MSPLAAGMFVLGAPELIVILIILLVLFSGARFGQAISKPERRGERMDLTPQEMAVFVLLGAILLAAIGILVWRP